MTKLTKSIRRYTSISATIDILRRKELPLLDPQTWDDRNDCYFMALYKEQKSINGLYGLCAAQCSETYHHWRVFTGTSDGACLEIKRKPLEAELRKIRGVRCGSVEYLKPEEVELLNTEHVCRLPFVKRIGFAAEDEYRIIAEDDEDQCPAISVALSLDWINRIYLNPWLPESIAESVSETLRAVPGCSNIQVSKSQLIDSTRWKRAGDKVIGRKRARNSKLRESINKK